MQMTALTRKGPRPSTRVRLASIASPAALPSGWTKVSPGEMSATGTYSSGFGRGDGVPRGVLCVTIAIAQARIGTPRESTAWARSRGCQQRFECRFVSGEAGAKHQLQHTEFERHLPRFPSPSRRSTAVTFERGQNHAYRQSRGRVAVGVLVDVTRCEAVVAGQQFTRVSLAGGWQVANMRRAGGRVCARETTSGTHHTPRILAAYGRPLPLALGRLSPIPLCRSASISHVSRIERRAAGLAG